MVTILIAPYNKLLSSQIIFQCKCLYLLSLFLQNEQKVVQATYDILTPISCLVIDWGDLSPVETYGDQSRCNTTHADAKYMGLLTTPYDLKHAYA